MNDFLFPWKKNLQGSIFIFTLHEPNKILKPGKTLQEKWTDFAFSRKQEAVTQ